MYIVGNIKLNITIILLLILVPLFPDLSFSADENGMDVVLVMDSSGSMKKTDPLSLRIPAAKLFISLLDENDRAGVTSFNDKAYLIKDLTPVDNRADREKLLRASEKITSDGLYTNLYDALDKGLDILSSRKDGDRTGVVILMSDGMMDTGDTDRDRLLLNRIKSDLTGKLKQAGVKVYTIAFTEQSEQRLLKKVSKRTGGFYNLALADSDFHVIFTSIFESLKTPEMLPMVKNGFLIDRSVKEVTIVATKASPDTKIRLNAPDGQTYTYRDRRSGIKWFVSNKFDMVTVKLPAEGQWEILFSTGENNRAYIITDLKLRSNFDHLYTTFGKPMDIKIWLEKDGKPMDEQDVLDKIDVFIELSGPDGKTRKLDPFHKGGGMFERRIAPFTAGNYKMRIIAKGMTFEREKAFIFNVADVKESREDLEIERREKEADKHAEENKETEQQPLQKAIKDTVLWGVVIAQFVVINILLFTFGFLYLKRDKLGKLTKLDRLVKLKDLLKKGKKGDKEEKRTAGEDGPGTEKRTETEDKRMQSAEKEQPGENTADGAAAETAGNQDKDSGEKVGEIEETPEGEGGSGEQLKDGIEQTEEKTPEESPQEVSEEGHTETEEETADTEKESSAENDETLQTGDIAEQDTGETDNGQTTPEDTDVKEEAEAREDEVKEGAAINESPVEDTVEEKKEQIAEEAPAQEEIKQESPGETHDKEGEADSEEEKAEKEETSEAEPENKDILDQNDLDQLLEQEEEKIPEDSMQKEDSNEGHETGTNDREEREETAGDGGPAGEEKEQ